MSAGTIAVEVDSLGGNVFRYQFVPDQIDLLQYQEIDIRFDPARFGSLANGVANSAFRLTLLQPNNPPGAFGDYSALSLVDHPSMAGLFSVDVTSLSSGLPGALEYSIHQFDPAGLRITATIGSGSAEVSAIGAPEPGGWILLLTGLVTIGALRGAKPRR